MSLSLPQFRPMPGRYHTAALAALRAVSAEPGTYANAYPVPDAANAVLAAGQPIEIRLSVPVGTWVWGFSATSSAAAGFEAQVIDLREGAPFWGQPVNYANVSGQGSAAGITFPLFILPAPRLVIEPGMLSIKLRNLAATSNTVQFVVFTIEPEARAL